MTCSSRLSVSGPDVVLCLQVSSAYGRTGAASAANVSPALLRLQPAGQFRAGGLFQVADDPGGLDERV